jgi:hypothetical protein
MSKEEGHFGESAEKETKDRTIDDQAPRSPDAPEDKAKRKEPMEKTIDDLGPTLPELKWWRKIWLVLMYAFKHQKLRIAIMSVFLVLVALGVLFWSEMRLPSTSSHSPESIIEWLLNAQTILGIGTLLVALFVWIGEIEENWQNDLPKRLSLFFFWEAKPLIVCRYVWLAGEDEIRTWGQQVGVQAQDALPDEKPSDSFLHFGPDVQTRKPELLVGPKGEVWKHYSICLRLTGLTKSLKRTKDYCRYQNIAGIYIAADNFPLELVESVQEVSSWKQVMIQKKWSSNPSVSGDQAIKSR